MFGGLLRFKDCARESDLEYFGGLHGSLAVSVVQPNHRLGSLKKNRALSVLRVAR